MAQQLHFCAPISLLALFSLATFAFEPSGSDKAQVTNFAFSWLYDNNTFQAGDIATIKIKVLGDFDSKNKNAFNPTLTVNQKTGNSCYVTGVFLDIATWSILFTPIRVGVFNVIIIDDPFKVFDSSLHFNVLPGRIYPSVCYASWLGHVNEFEAGAKATVMIATRDAFGNNVSSTGEDLNTYNFRVSILYANKSCADVLAITHMHWNEFGDISIEFIAAKAGNLLLHIEAGNQTLDGSPLPYKVNPGALDVSNCLAKPKFQTNAWQLFSKMEIFVYQQDQYGNLVPGLYEFDADVVEKEMNLSVPVADLNFEEVEPAIKLISFSLLEPGNFLLTISDMKHNGSISNMPFAYTVFIGYCDGSASIVNGSGLHDSVAGEMAQFSVYLNDVFQYPSFVALENIAVQVVGQVDASYVQPKISPITNGSGHSQYLGYGAARQREIAPAPIVEQSNISAGRSRSLITAFNVAYTPEKSGIYSIYVLCGNILLNSGRPFKKEVRAGKVNISMSGTVKFSAKVPKLTENEIVVLLMDSFSNPVLSQESWLKLEIASVNKSGFSSGTFVDNNDGSYAGHYIAKEVGTYEICALFDGKPFSPCPFGINVYGGEYFPKAYDDNISVWEGESIAFDVLVNDYFAGQNASIVEFSQPDHGSLLEHGRFFRYTPYQDYYGNDSFMYKISDVNGNLASAIVNISVLSVPPFISSPILLEAVEDVISPRYGGFPEFEIKYSDPTENISVTLSAKSGTVFLSPVLMQFGQLDWGAFSAEKGDEEAKALTVHGYVDAVNLVLQSIQYLGNENFSGDDSVRVSASNANGKNDLDVPIFVEPMNDPPFINVPKFIILKNHGDESLIYDKGRDRFEFSVGDPDLMSFPGKDFQFVVMFSLEVDDGFLMTSLPAELINTTEQKLMNSYQWQPLQTYVTISKHFMIKANGVRFRGTVNDCNSVMQQLSYHGGENGAVLMVKINDLGHYGCQGACKERVSSPLYAEATVNLIQRRPMNSLEAHLLGSIIIIEFLMVFSLGVMLLFFSCKCAVLLISERIGSAQNSDLSGKQNFQKITSSTDFSESPTYFTGCSLLSLSGQPSNCRLCTRYPAGTRESGEYKFGSTQSFSSGHPQSRPGFIPLYAERRQSNTI